MCISKNFSIASFATGVSGSLFLLKYGKAEYEASNKVIAVVYIFISLMQVIDYMIWSDLNCTKGLNKIASIVGPILNHLQPQVMLFSLLNFMKSRHPIVPNNILLITNVIYILYIIYNYIRYVKTTSLCTGTNETGHLTWQWNTLLSGTLYLIILFLNTVNYYYDVNFRIASMVLLATLLISFTKFNENIGELWCFLSVSIPYIVLLLQYTVL